LVAPPVDRGYQPETAKRTVEEKDGLVAFGQSFISNPDLPERIRNGIKLTPYDRDTFYTPEHPKGYIDYPCPNRNSNFGDTEKSRLWIQGYVQRSDAGFGIDHVLCDC